VDEPVFIIIDVPEPKTVTLASEDEPVTNAGRQFVSSVLCLNYANGESLEN
jgi:hypothetical protein